MPDADRPRLIEVAFPLKQASLDSVHEKNVRHGHISTLHIWPARRPLAACRAALIATLLPDPGTPQGRKELLEKIGGKVVTEVQRKKVGGKTVETIKERTEGGVLRWGNENSPDMDWFRAEIKKAYGGRAPRVLDPFAGGGAIPLEAMRLGCEATAIDINPVAWFLLKCTLEYPQKLAGQTRPLPKFAVDSPEFMESYFMNTGKLTKAQVRKRLAANQLTLFPPPDADLAWHVRAWGWWVLQQARKDLERFYPTIDGKPTVAYLWARTVTCKNCRATIPLLKTRWLCKKDNKRVVLTMEVKRAAGTEARSTASPPGAVGGEGSVERASVPAALFSQYRRNLPHWRLTGATYFLTWRLHQAQTDLTPGERDRVVSALRHFDGERYTLLAYVVMNDHVHVLVRPHGGHRLEQTTHSWKSFTANRMQKESGRVGAVWQDESFDRIVRDEDEFWEKARYILDNPVKRWPGTGDYLWAWLRRPDDTEARATQADPPSPPRGGGSAGVSARDPSGAWVEFGVQAEVPVVGGNAAQKREYDKRIAGGTMSRSGASCPCCPAIMTMEDIRHEGKSGRLSSIMTAVVVGGATGKEYRSPNLGEIQAADWAEAELDRVFAEVPFGLPDEPIAGKDALGIRVPLYGLDRWLKLWLFSQPSG